MKTLVILKFLFFICWTTFGQGNKVDIKAIEKIANTPVYEELFERYSSNDTTLTLEDYIIIYYGQPFQNGYSAYGSHDSVQVLRNYLNSDEEDINFNKVLEFTNDILGEYPFNIEHIYLNAVAYYNLGEDIESQKWLYKYDKLISTILSSGDGTTENTAMIVIKVSDEYSILSALELEVLSQSLTNKKNKYYDYLELKENELGLEGLYFDIGLFYGKNF